MKSSRGYLSNDQVARLARACGPDADVIILLAYTGLRWGEMAGLKTARIDLDRRRIDVAEAVSDPRGRVIWGTPKSHERRSVPFPDFLSDSLRARCEGKHPDDLVFMAPDGGVLRSGNFRNRRFNSALASIQAADPEFPKVTPHDLRHTAASLAVSVGANVKAVQRMLGHSSAAMTLDVYADLFDDDLDAVAVALNGSVPFSNVFKMCSLDEDEAVSEPERGHKKRPLPSVS
ncbi:site-specific integrase [Cryobacterium sp. N19]|uniref:site-specific integrase n=1 Tax=Cryobacterium sp. N19 TaxID=2048288 RepID=UPI001E376894|nr:site-specific integrase [Cryobacterium sp. N19]